MTNFLSCAFLHVKTCLCTDFFTHQFSIKRKLILSATIVFILEKKPWNNFIYLTFNSMCYARFHQFLLGEAPSLDFLRRKLPIRVAKLFDFDGENKSFMFFVGVRGSSSIDFFSSFGLSTRLPH